MKLEKTKMPIDEKTKDSKESAEENSIPPREEPDARIVVRTRGGYIEFLTADDC